MKLTKIKPNPNNPRVIKDEKFQQLCNSIKDFPKMMELRPIIVDAGGIILGGNMRYRALIELGYKDIPDSWVKKAEDLTEDEAQRFIITDNVGFGSWNYDTLANEWDAIKLQEWGLDIPGFEEEKPTADKQESTNIVLSYSEDEYVQVKNALAKVAETPEQAVLELLGLK